VISPPPFLEWLAVIGGSLAILKEIVELISQWRHRNRTVFRLLSAVTYYDTWTKSDVEENMASHSFRAQSPSFGEGDYRSFFTILEFAVVNHHPDAISVGRFLIDDWIYADRYIQYTQGMVYGSRDYRVFDLHTKSPTTLRDYVQLESGDSIAFRVEILEEACGPGWGSHRGIYSLRLRPYQIKFRTTAGDQKHKVEPVRRRRSNWIYRWSDLLGPPSSSYSEGWPSQDVEPKQLDEPPWDASLKKRLQWKTKYVLYGTPYAHRGQRIQFSEIRGRLFGRRKAGKG